METKIKINSLLYLQLLKSKKAFICYNLSNDKTKIEKYIITSDLQRYRNSYSNFKVLSCIKKQFNELIF